MILQVVNFVTQQIFRTVAQQVANPRADKTVALLQVNRQDQIGEAFQQILTELLLLLDLLLHIPLFGQVHMRDLLADDILSNVSYSSPRILQVDSLSVFPAWSDSQVTSFFWLVTTLALLRI